MKLSLLNQLKDSNNSDNSNNTSDDKEYKNYNEIPNIQYEQLDQLRCYIDLAVLLQDEYFDLLHAGKEDFLTNYEQVDDIVSPTTKKMYKVLNMTPYINVGLDLLEFLQNALLVKTIITHSSEVIPMNELSSLFNNVCSNGEEIAKKFVCLLLFFELCTIDNDNNNVNTSKFVYACNLYESTLTKDE